MSIKNGKLVVESQSSARTWKALWGKRSYKYSDKIVFRTEVTTGSSTTSRYLMVGAEGDWGIGQYRRHTALFDGNGIYVNYYNNGYRNIRLGAAKNNTAYIVELVTENSGTKLYIYEKGKLKSSAYVDSRPYNDWGKMQSFIEAQNYPGANASKMYINVQSEAKSAGSLYGKYIIEKSINDVILNY